MTENKNRRGRKCEESKSKGKDHPRTGLEGPNGGQMYSSTLPSYLALDVGG